MTDIEPQPQYDEAGCIVYTMYTTAGRAYTVHGEQVGYFAVRPGTVTSPGSWVVDNWITGHTSAVATTHEVALQIADELSIVCGDAVALPTFEARMQALGPDKVAWALASFVEGRRVRVLDKCPRYRDWVREHAS